MPDVLTDRALNRATLSRQHLLLRTPDGALAVIDHLVGLQAQVPLDPYTALWSRIENFDPVALSRLLIDRAVVRLVLIRGTIHLVSAADALALRSLFQPVLDREIANHSQFGPALEGLDLDPIVAFARSLLDDNPLGGGALRAALAERFPDQDAAALALACRNHLALVQVPPRGVWGQSLQPTLTTAESWLGRPVSPTTDAEAVVLRYLAAFGPATGADLVTWSRIPALRDVLHELRPRLRTFNDERGRELFDLVDAPRPDADTPAPARFLPEYDNLLLSHADRTRFTPKEDEGQFAEVQGAIRGTVLHDGLVAAVWRIDQIRPQDPATLVIEHPARLTAEARSDIEDEGGRLVRFKADQTTAHDVQLLPLG